MLLSSTRKYPCMIWNGLFNHDACLSFGPCWHICGNSRLVDCLLQWTERIDWVELCHLLLRGKTDDHAEHVASVLQYYPHLSHLQLPSLEFPAALKMTKGLFQNIPRKIFNKTLYNFLECRLNYLSVGVVAGLSSLLSRSGQLYVFHYFLFLQLKIGCYC